MKKIKLTKGAYAFIDDIDYDATNKYSWYLAEKSPNNNYAVTDMRDRDNIFGTRHVSMHRFILRPDKSMQVDHIDADGLNNRRSNLRICTQTQNNGNFRIGVRNKSGYKGVSWHKSTSKWRATLLYSGKQQYLGIYDDKKKAAEAYNIAAVKYFGEFARLNEIK